MKCTRRLPSTSSSMFFYLSHNLFFISFIIYLIDKTNIDMYIYFSTFERSGRPSRMWMMSTAFQLDRPALSLIMVWRTLWLSEWRNSRRCWSMAHLNITRYTHTHTHPHPPSCVPAYFTERHKKGCCNIKSIVWIWAISVPQPVITHGTDDCYCLEMTGLSAVHSTVFFPVCSMTQTSIRGLSLCLLWKMYGVKLFHWNTILWHTCCNIGYVEGRQIKHSDDCGDWCMRRS